MSRHLTTDPQIPIFHRGALAYPAHEPAPRKIDLAMYVRLSDALVEDWSFDAHTCAASYPEVPRRLATDDALDLRDTDGHPPEMVMFAIDVDGPDHVRTPAWWQDEQQKLARLTADYPRPFIYGTRGGYRVIYTMRPHPIGTLFAAQHWAVSYLSWLDLIEERYQIVGDRHQAPWTALYRLPVVTRDGVVQQPDVIGNPREIGIWTAPFVPESEVMPVGGDGDEDRPIPEYTAPPDDDVAAAAIVLAKAWPRQGRRLGQLSLAGALARQGWPVEAVAEFLYVVCEAAERGNGDYAKRLRAARSSVEKVEAGVSVTGWPALAKWLGEEPVAEAMRLLGVQSAVPECDPAYMAAVHAAMKRKKVRTAPAAPQSRGRTIGDAMSALIRERLLRGTT